MSKRFLAFMGLLLFVSSLAASPASDATAETTGKTAIILASFGTTVPSAVESITNIQARVQQAFPGIPVKITFTSNIIRSVWKKRQAQARKWLGQGIPADILYAKNIIATFGELAEEGYRHIVVQPTHIFYMEQAYDLTQYVDAMRSIQTIKPKWRPFDKIALGRPALGTIGADYNYHDDIQKVLRTLSADVELARSQKAMLVYMGHGNEHWSTGIYMEAAKMMRRLYPDVLTFIGVVEGFPGIDDLCADLAPYPSGRIILKPFMIVAGDHAINDMAGDADDSWKSVLTRKGFTVTPVLTGLGSNNAFAAVFIDHIRDAARDAGIELNP